MADASMDISRNSPPDWDSHPADLLCPLCRYNLRYLTTARCPECGFAFRLRSSNTFACICRSRPCWHRRLFRCWCCSCCWFRLLISPVGYKFGALPDGTAEKRFQNCRDATDASDSLRCSMLDVRCSMFAFDSAANLVRKTRFRKIAQYAIPARYIRLSPCHPQRQPGNAAALFRFA